MRPFAKDLLALLMAWALMVCVVLMPLPAMAMGSDHATYPLAFGTMSNKADAKAKVAEGKLESAYGEFTGDTGHQIKGIAKQVQGSAMNAAEDLKQGAKSVAKKVGGSDGKVEADLS
jgi:uncharacterized protein YjbJ (UPF0337 family)